jgi:magnesium transporter
VTNLDQIVEETRDRLAATSAQLPESLLASRAPDIVDVMNKLSCVEAAEVMRLLPLALAVSVCDQPTLRRRSTILEQLDPTIAAKILEGLAADQRSAVIRSMSPYQQHHIVPKVSDQVQREIKELLRYPQRTAGGIMTTEFVRLLPTMSVEEALRTIKTYAADQESIYACYVLEQGSGRLLGAISLRDLVLADPAARISSVMHRKPVSVGAYQSQKEAANKISKYNLLAIPVLEADERVVGFVTVDDVIDVLLEEETERTLRMGAVEPSALDLPYIATPFATMVKKRATWLIVLFLGEMLTATAMGYFEDEISKAVVLALFLPLIISSGGNSGSQATTLVIRAMALGEFTLADWWKIAWREVIAGLALGAILGIIGFVRIAAWTPFTNVYGNHWLLVAVTVGLSLVGVVAWGTICGSMLPFILKRLGTDPATSSAPFVATLVDVTGLVIYFSVALIVMHGTIL